MKKEAGGNEAREHRMQHPLPCRLFSASCLPASLPRFSSRPSVLVMLVPGIGKAANGFAQTHGKLGDGLQALDGGGRQPSRRASSSSVFPRIPVSGLLTSWRRISPKSPANSSFGNWIMPADALGDPHAAVQHARDDRQEMPRARHKIHGAGSDQKRQVALAFPAPPPRRRALFR